MPGAVDQFNVDMFEVLCRRVVNDWRGIGAARRARAEEEKCGQGNPKQVHRHSSFIDASSSVWLPLLPWGERYGRAIVAATIGRSVRDSRTRPLGWRR
jgi:hypothetical protein